MGAERIETCASKFTGARVIAAFHPCAPHAATVRRLESLAREEQQVLRVPPFPRSGRRPERHPQAVVAGETLRPEQQGPELRPLLIDVVGPALKRQRRGNRTTSLSRASRSMNPGAAS